MKIAIYGIGRCGKYVIQQIKDSTCSKVEISVLIDNNPIYWGKVEHNIQIVDLEGFINLYSSSTECVLIAVQDELIAQEMAVSLIKKNYKEIYFLPKVVLEAKLPVLSQSGELISYVRHINFCKPVLPYVEYHVSDYCNLKCKRCGHFSNLVTEKIFPDIYEFKNMLKELTRRFRSIKVFRLMGGEPFVNPDLGLFLYEVRKAFPYVDIKIVSNGLLLPQISDEMVKTIRDCNAVIEISQYPPTRLVVENIICFAQEKDLNVQMSEEVKKFFVQQNLGITEKFEKIWSNCISKACYFLRGTHLYVCPAVILSFENREFLELNITEDEVRKNSFDLMNGKENGWDILKKLLYPFEFCRHCTDMKWFDWSTSKGEIKKEDWFVK